MEIRHQLLSWDSVDRKENYYPRFLQKPAREVYDRIFADQAQLVDRALVSAAPKMDQSRRQNLGGIYLGANGYLTIVKYSESGMPEFDRGQLRQFQMNFHGFIPVIVGNPRPADLVALSGLN